MIVKKKHLAGCKYVRRGSYPFVHNYSDLTCISCLKKALVDLNRINQHSRTPQGMIVHTRTMIIEKLVQSGCGFSLRA